MPLQYYVIDIWTPSDPIRVVWDMWMLLMLMYVIICVPYLISFDVSTVRTHGMNMGSSMARRAHGEPTQGSPRLHACSVPLFVATPGLGLLQMGLGRDRDQHAAWNREVAQGLKPIPHTGDPLLAHQLHRPHGQRLLPA